MNDFRYLYYLTRIDGLGSVRIKRLLDKFGNAKNVFDSSARELADVENISSKLADSVIRSVKDFVDYTIEYDSIVKKLDKLGADVITYEDQKYPHMLKKTYDPPIILYCRGNIDDYSIEPAIAIVGTRKPSDYGKKIAEGFAFSAIALGPSAIFTTTSGGSFGVTAIFFNFRLKVGTSL